MLSKKQWKSRNSNNRYSAGSKEVTKQQKHNVPNITILQNASGKNAARIIVGQTMDPPPEGRLRGSLRVALINQCFLRYDF
jgi:hypothetical protein